MEAKKQGMGEGTVGGRHRWGRRFAVGALAAALGAGIGAQAFAQGAPDGGPGHRHGHHGMRGERDPAKMQQFMEQRLRKSLADVGANETQQTQIVGIMRAAFADLKPLREQAQAARRASAEALGKPTVDRAQLEVLRTQQMQVADQVSKRMSQAFADAADVLTPEQRAKFAERFQNRMHRGGWRGGVAG